MKNDPKSNVVAIEDRRRDLKEALPEAAVTIAPTHPRAAPNPGPAERALAAGEYLGPARVTGVAGGAVEVDVPGVGPVRARMALAFPYRPAVGDSLLVIGRGDRHYVIGVLEGSGATVLSFPGGVDLESGGVLRLTGREGVEIQGPEVGVDAGKLRIYAEAAVQKLSTFYQRVSGIWSVRAREAETVVDETSLTRARSATILTDETMSINGKQIHLG